jgi:hypothetical protein
MDPQKIKKKNAAADKMLIALKNGALMGHCPFLAAPYLRPFAVQRSCG